MNAILSAAIALLGRSQRNAAEIEVERINATGGSPAAGSSWSCATPRGSRRRRRNTNALFAIVFALDGGLAGLAGGLAAPVRSLTVGMGFCFGTIGFPAFTDELIYIAMILVLVLVLRPTGLFGREVV